MECTLFIKYFILECENLVSNSDISSEAIIKQSEKNEITAKKTPVTLDLNSAITKSTMVLSTEKTVTLKLSQSSPTMTPPEDIEEDHETNLKILKLLAHHNVSYKTLDHLPTRTSQESADIRGVPLSSGAKAMLLRGKKNSLPCSKTFCLAVMSAAAKADLKKLKQLLGVKELSMATESEVRLVTGCIPGAVPPFGSLFENVFTVADSSLQKQGTTINFNAGLRTKSIIGLSTSDYFDIEKPMKLDFSTLEL